LTGSFAAGLYVLAGLALVAAASTFWLQISNPAQRELVSVPAE
jgi:hypothetical protein